MNCDSLIGEIKLLQLYDKNHNESLGYKTRHYISLIYSMKPQHLLNSIEGAIIDSFSTIGTNCDRWLMSGTQSMNSVIDSLRTRIDKIFEKRPMGRWVERFYHSRHHSLIYHSRYQTLVDGMRINRGDIILFNDELYIVMRANGNFSVGVVPLIKTDDHRYSCSQQQPKYVQSDRSWRFPYPHAIEMILHCSPHQKMTWEEYRQWFEVHFQRIQRNIDDYYERKGLSHEQRKERIQQCLKRKKELDECIASERNEIKEINKLIGELY